MRLCRSRRCTACAAVPSFFSIVLSVVLVLFPLAFSLRVCSPPAVRAWAPVPLHRPPRLPAETIFSAACVVSGTQVPALLPCCCFFTPPSPTRRLPFAFALPPALRCHSTCPTRRRRTAEEALGRTCYVWVHAAVFFLKQSERLLRTSPAPSSPVLSPRLLCL